MAYPTGTGSEILRRGKWRDQSSTSTAFIFDGTDPSVGTSSYTVPALHIITILNIIVCEQGGNTSEIEIKYADETRLCDVQSIGPSETFVFSEKIVLIGGDGLKFVISSAGNVDVSYCYFDQNWID